MSFSRLRPAIISLILIALVGGAILIQRVSIHHLLRDEALSTTSDWTNYLAANVTDLDRIMRGEAPSDGTRARLREAEALGSIYRYQIFDTSGHRRFVSGSAGRTQVDFDARAEEVAETGKPQAEFAAGQSSNRPDYFSETYVPLVRDGKVLAVVEAVIDQTVRRDQFHSALLLATSGFAALILVAFGIPAAAWRLGTHQKRRADQRAHFLAKHDTITGLANRTQLAEVLAEALTGRPDDRPDLAVHCINLDSFKDVNDVLGHEAGDAVLRAVATRLNAIAHEGDIVARLGSDEFAVVQMNAPDRTTAEAFAHKIIGMISEPIECEGHTLRVTCCVGVAVAPEHGNDASRLLKSADLALVKAKTIGRAQIRVFVPLLDVELFQRLTLERTVEQAILDKRFVLEYQPQFDGAGRRLVGFEALLRLPTDVGGFIPPSIFIPAAEAMGVISQIGSWAIREACTAAAGWPDDLKIAVNLSPAQFAAGNVPAIVAGALSDSGLRPGRLEMEVTESLLIQDTGKVTSDLNQVKALGVDIVMDDFGTGYSSLSYLWRFPFDKLKIDRSFLKAMSAGDLVAEKIIRAIVTLARALNMRVNVEGIETPGNLEFVSRIDCDELQGFILGRPMTATQVVEAIAADSSVTTRRCAAC